jgi:hypothetical protein
LCVCSLDGFSARDKLYSDTYYNVDHEKNGVRLPFASSLPEWSTASAKKKRELMFKIMGLSSLQMHQGQHSKRNDYGVGAMPYKARVNDDLQKNDNYGMTHYAGRTACKDCKGKKQANICHHEKIRCVMWIRLLSC